MFLYYSQVINKYYIFLNLTHTPLTKRKVRNTQIAVKVGFQQIKHSFFTREIFSTDLSTCFSAQRCDQTHRWDYLIEVGGMSITEPSVQDLREQGGPDIVIHVNSFNQVFESSCRLYSRQGGDRMHRDTFNFKFGYNTTAQLWSMIFVLWKCDFIDIFCMGDTLAHICRLLCDMQF